jgi:hypothetical protein
VLEHGVKWNVIYDARGHFTEPHSDKSFGIGTLEVRRYLAGHHDPFLVDADFSQAKVETSGPAGNFGAVLFIEKEGFAPLFRAAGIAERFDVALMSTKGMSVVAARALADEMCSDHGIPLLLLHDFDKAGFSIAGTLQRDTRRYEFQNAIEVIDLGLSLEDVEVMGLERSMAKTQPRARGAREGGGKGAAMLDHLLHLLHRPSQVSPSGRHHHGGPRSTRIWRQWAT